MKEFIKGTLLRKRSIGNWVYLGTGLFMLIVSIIYIAVDGGALKIRDYSRTIGFLMLLIGSLIALLSSLCPLKTINSILPWISSIFYAVAWGRQLYLTAYPVADIFTGVNWFGGNANNYITIFVLITIGVVANIVSCFMRQGDNEK